MDGDDFFDANDEIVDENEMVGDIATANLAQHLFMQNKFDESKELVNPEDKDGFSLWDLYKKIYLLYRSFWNLVKHMYHHHARTTLSILEALMTFSPDDFAIAIETAEETMRESAVLSKE